MGSCTSVNLGVKKSQVSSSIRERKEQTTYLSFQADKKQLACLELIYDDLVSRTPDKKMNVKIFQVFFHMNATFGAPLFRKFCNGGTLITKDIFSDTILKYFKDGIEKKLKFLFCLYDLDGSHGVSFKQLLAILLTSPQDQLKDVLSKQAFLQTLTLEEMSYYLMPQIRDIQNFDIEYKQNMTLFPYLPQNRKNTIYQEPSLANFKMSLDLKNSEHLKRIQSASTDISSRNSSTELNQENDQKTEDSEGETIDRKIIQEEFKKKINVSLHSTPILRRYAEYVFAKNNLDKQNGQIPYQKFRYIVKENPKIYKQGLEGFHQYLWLHENGVPKYLTITPTISGYCLQVSKDIKKTVYLSYIKNSLMVFQNEDKNLPISIKNLQGLNIEAAETEFEYGFSIKHQDGHYPTKLYLFPTKQIQSLWLDALVQYQLKDVFKKYKLQEKIGQGNFCNVYKCTNRQTNIKGAMKIFDKTVRTEQQINTVNSESQMLATCVMPNVVRAYQRFETKNNIYLVMQLIQGGTLFQYAKKDNGKSLPQIQAKRIMKALLETIKNLHEIGIIHRDLKLENILMKLEGGKFIPKIIDFGLSIYQVDLANIEQKRKFVGTPNFAPPQIFFHESYDETVDIFSLGVILHFLLTSTLPFHGINFSQIKQLTIDCHINFSAKKWNNVSQQAKDLVSRMVCYHDYRITAAEAVNHPWFSSNIE